jgi:hypothetical protein
MSMYDCVGFKLEHCLMQTDVAQINGVMVEAMLGELASGCGYPACIEDL